MIFGEISLKSEVVKLLLIDGNYYVYRSFYAIRDLRNSRGEATNAVYGFVKSVRKMLRDITPDYVAVVWDTGIPERRMQLQPEYKQQRKEMPDEMIPQLKVIQDLAPLLGIQGVSLPNTEADDLMASYTVAAVERGVEVVLATNDKDLFQLVRPGVGVYSTNKADLSGGGDFTILGVEEVMKKWGVPPEQILGILALTGDSADNIPGVPGVGPKTAVKILQDIGASDGAPGLLNAADKIQNEKLREKVVAHRDLIEQNLEMVRLDLDLDLPLPLENLSPVADYPRLLPTIQELEFKTLYKELQKEATAAEGNRQAELF